jgi:hypothetical protein
MICKESRTRPWPRPGNWVCFARSPQRRRPRRVCTAHLLLLVRRVPVLRVPRPQASAPPAANWLCFSEATGRQYVHNFFKEPRLRSFCPFADWVCFARLSRVPAARVPPGPPGTGFVWRISPRASASGLHPPIRNPQSPIRNRGAPGPQIGFVLRIYPPAGPDWVCFAHLVSGVCPQPASSNPQSAITNPQSRGPWPPNWVLFAHFTPGRATPHTTSFSHIPQSPQVWLCFAQFPRS